MWLLSDEAAEAMQAAQKQSEGFQVTPTIRAQGDLITMAGRTAEIEVKGTLTKEPDFFARIFGGGNTTYSGLIAALAQADQDEIVADIQLTIDSPGGNADGLIEVMDAIRGTVKPVRAVVEARALSAAYMIASQADEIIAKDRASAFGSLGLRMDVHTFEDVVTVVNTKSPWKAPDARTEAGKAAIRADMDAFHALIVEAIAGGRKKTTEDVNNNFGQGLVFRADEAKTRGMIDSIGAVVAPLKGAPMASADVAPVVVAENKPHAQGRKVMDLKTLKTEHPGVYAEAVQEGHGQGVKAELDRVGAHLTLGANGGEPGMKIATEAIMAGDALTETRKAQYMTLALNDQAINALAADQVGDLGAEVIKAAGEDAGDGKAEAVAEQYSRTMGHTPKNEEASRA